MHNSDFFEYDSPTFNVAGNLDGLQKNTWNDRLVYEHLYADGIILEASNYEVMVDGVSPVKGVYKDGNPYSGFFVHADNEMELYLTDYFKNGSLVAQYSRPAFTIDEDGVVHSAEHEYDYALYEENAAIKLTLKTSYKNGVVHDGVQYHFYKMKDRAALLATEKFVAGELHCVDLLIVAVHYGEFARIRFVQDGYTISSVRHPEMGNVTLEVFPSKGLVQLASKFSFEYSVRSISDSFLPQGGSVHYFHDGVEFRFQQTYGVNIGEEFYSSDSDERTIVHSIFNSLLTRTPEISVNGPNRYIDLFSDHLDDEEFYCKLFLVNNVPFLGTMIAPDDAAAGTYQYSKFKEGKLMDAKKGLSMEELVNAAQFNYKDFVVERIS